MQLTCKLNHTRTRSEISKNEISTHLVQNGLGPVCHSLGILSTTSYQLCTLITRPRCCRHQSPETLLRQPAVLKTEEALGTGDRHCKPSIAMNCEISKSGQNTRAKANFWENVTFRAPIALRDLPISRAHVYLALCWNFSEFSFAENRDNSYFAPQSSLTYLW